MFISRKKYDKLALRNEKILDTLRKERLETLRLLGFKEGEWSSYYSEKHPNIVITVEMIYCESSPYTELLKSITS